MKAWLELTSLSTPGYASWPTKVRAVVTLCGFLPLSYAKKGNVVKILFYMTNLLPK